MASFSIWQGVIDRIHTQISNHGWSVRDCRVLLPHPALLSMALAAWKQHSPNGYTPRFCTLNGWAQEGGQWLPSPEDVAFSPYQDAQTARRLLGSVRGASVQTPWPQWLIKNTYAVAGAACAVAPELRQSWYTRMQALLFSASSSPWGATEQMLLQTALAWAGHSRYASDEIWSEVHALRQDARHGRASLIIVTGVQPLTLLEKALLAHLGPAQTLHFSLPEVQLSNDNRPSRTSDAGQLSCETAPLIRVFQTPGSYDEAAVAAHCVIEHVMAQDSPVALVAVDRQQVRHIQSMLRSSGLTVRDETGWLLSTSPGAGRLFALLQACQGHADARDCLHALRAMPRVDDRVVDGLEQQVRQHRWRSPSQLMNAVTQGQEPVAQQSLLVGLALLERYRVRMRSRQRASAWLRCVHELMEETGLRDWLQADAEGQSLLEHIPRPDRKDFDDAANDGPHQGMLCSFADWLSALRESFEATAYVPDAPGTCDVCILPLHHLPGRNFAAVVLPGCNDQTLPSVPRPVGFWGQKQRSLLGLPTHSDEALAQTKAFESALAWPRVDLLWSGTSGDGQPRFASPLLQSALQASLAMPVGARVEQCPDPRPVAHLPVLTALVPSPSAGHRLPKRLSATAYNDLRTCPYRFFALRMLGMRAIKPLDEPADARDQGQWLHAVLKHYHEHRDRAGWLEVVLERDLRLLQELSLDLLGQMHLSAHDMWHLWNQKEALFEAYLQWQSQHEADSFRFLHGETWMERPLGSTILHGQIDRVDIQTDRRCTLLIDYKLSKPARVKEKLKAEVEDVQLPFYALLERGPAVDEGIEAAYLSLHVQDGVCSVTMPHLVSRAKRLAAGIEQDMVRIAQGHVLRPTGEDTACEHCDVRGVCRKDDWQ